MPDYQQGKIYKIVCETTGLVYIGSTTQTLERRLYAHEKKQFLQVYSSYQILHNRNYKIELIENYPCKNNEQLRAREAYHCSKTDCVNLIRPYLSKDERILESRVRVNEYRIQFPEKVKQSKKDDYNKNREVILARQKERIECECGCIIRRGGIARHHNTKIHTEKISSKYINLNATPPQENTQTETL